MPTNIAIPAYDWTPEGDAPGRYEVVGFIRKKATRFGRWARAFDARANAEDILAEGRDDLGRQFEAVEVHDRFNRSAAIYRTSRPMKRSL